MFFSKKTPPEELVSEFITVSDKLGIQTVNTIMTLTGNTSKSVIEYVNSNLDNFKVLWPTSSCVWGAVYKAGDARRFCERARDAVEKQLAGHPFGVAMAKEILNEVGDAEGKFGQATTAIIRRTLPELQWDDNAHVIPGANFVSSLNYADYLVKNNKIAW